MSERAGYIRQVQPHEYEAYRIRELRRHGVGWAAEYIRWVNSPSPKRATKDGEPMILECARNCRPGRGAVEEHNIALEGFITAVGFWLCGVLDGDVKAAHEIRNMANRWFPEWPK